MNEGITSPLSTQEAAIASGSTVLHPGVTDRVQRLLEADQPANPPRVTLERAVRFTESFQETERAADCPSLGQGADASR